MMSNAIISEHDNSTVAEPENEFNQLRARIAQLEVTVARLHTFMGVGYRANGISRTEVLAVVAGIDRFMQTKELSIESAYDLIHIFGSMTREYVKLVVGYCGTEDAWRILTDGAAMLVQLIQHNPNPHVQTLYPYVVAARSNCVAHVMDYLTQDQGYTPIASMPAKDLHEAILTLIPTVSEYVKLA